jgi:UDP-N-acetylglucosamine 4,6-dehydratase (inverting)
MKKNILNNKSVLITGGTGSFGQKFTEVILNKHNPRKVIIFSRDEFKQHEMKLKFQKFIKKIRFFLGDVRDLQRITLALEDVDIVVHAAALKQVPASEYNPFEFVKTNVLGTQNVIDASHKTNVSKVISLSTDKASSPVNLYGATKLTADKIVISANNFSGKKYSVVRYGNVVGSRGSIIPKILSQINDKFITITDERMTRFSITLDQGVSFVISCLNKMLGGEIFIPKIPSYRITDIVKAFSLNKKIKITGVRPGEKLHEEMISSTESLNTIEFKNYFVILSDVIHKKKIINSFEDYKGKEFKPYTTYNSLENTYLTIKQIKEMSAKL